MLRLMGRQWTMCPSVGRRLLIAVYIDLSGQSILTTEVNRLTTVVSQSVGCDGSVGVYCPLY